MRKPALILSLLLSVSCGGGDDDMAGAAFAGLWVGTVERRSESCSPDPVLAPMEYAAFEAFESSELRYTVTSLSELGSQYSLVDQNGRTFTGSSEPLNGRRIIFDPDVQPNGMIEQGPTSIRFDAVDRSRAQVVVSFFQNRFCTYVLEGEFVS